MSVSSVSTSRVAVIVVHYGNIDDTMACVGSVSKLVYGSFDILVIDNGMSEESLNVLKQEFPQVTVKSFPDNVGFAVAANLGLAEARKSGASFAWLLNNDTVIDDFSCLDILVKEADESGKSVISPLLVNLGRRRASLHSGAVFFPTLSLTFHGGTVVSRLLNLIFWSMPFLSGTALLIRLDRVSDPFFDEKFFAYYEDVDVCLKLGPGSIGVCKEAHILHKVSRSTGGGLWKHYLKARNLIYLARKHGMFNGRFIFCYWALFIPLEARKYLRHPLEYFRNTRRAWWKGREM